MPRRPDPESRYEVTDVEVLRVLSHPLRTRILGALRLEGPATASQLGRRLGESSGSTSYHLRQLARFGLVEDVEDQSSRRDRVWQARHALTSIDPQRFVGTEQEDMLDEFSALQLSRLVAQAERWQQQRRMADPAWVSAAGFSDATVRLSPQACAALPDRLDALLRELEQDSSAAPETSWVSVFLGALPLSDEEALS
jgi:DNA-binding transcriptional ArsR family regulator